MVDVLVLRALGLGDTLAAVPALRALRRATPGDIVLAGPELPASLLLADGIVDEVVPTSSLRDTGLPRAAVAVNLHGKGPESHRLLQAAGPGRIVAFASTAAGIDGPRWQADEPERSRWCRLIGSVLAVDTDPDDVRLEVPSVRTPPTADVVLHPGAAAVSRRWPADRWITVARRLAEWHRVVITGSEDEATLGRQIAERAGLPRECVLAGATTVPELASLVARSRLVVSGDTGVAHVAYAYEIPSVTLFGPTPPAAWGPPSQGPHTALWHGSAVGDPHAGSPDPALLEISTAEVLAACDDMLRRGSRHRP